MTHDFDAEIAEIQKRSDNFSTAINDDDFDNLMQAQSDRRALLRILATKEAEIERLRTALKPFAACIGNDNGDVTQHDHASHNAYCNAYFILRAPESSQ